MAKDPVRSSMLALQADAIDMRITHWMYEHGMTLLRYSLTIVFLWFGILKLLGDSPVTDLVSSTVYFVPPALFVPILGIWEIVIALCLVIKPLLRLGIFLMLLQLLGTFLSFLFVPAAMFNGVGLTLAGQFVIKNLVLISSALVVGSNLSNRT